MTLIAGLIHGDRAWLADAFRRPPQIATTGWRGFWNRHIAPLLVMLCPEKHLPSNLFFLFE
jgi:hypothetical protein